MQPGPGARVAFRQKSGQLREQESVFHSALRYKHRSPVFYPRSRLLLLICPVTVMLRAYSCQCVRVCCFRCVQARLHVQPTVSGLKGVEEVEEWDAEEEEASGKSFNKS